MALPRRNDGRLTDSLLKKYRHLEDGGWYCGTLDVLTGSDSLWGCFKPDKPRIITEEKRGFGNNQSKTKVIKYEHPPKKPTEAFFFKLPDALWQTIGENAGIYPSCSLNSQYSRIARTNPHFQFWAWLIDNPNVPIIFTEGAKKAGCLLSNGYATIALPGIFSGFRQQRDKLGNVVGLPHLIPQLLPFATKGREINFVFDSDPKPTTQKNVRKAIAKTGKLLQNKGCLVNVVTWKDEEKGVDDLIVAKGIDYYHGLYENRQSLAKYLLFQWLELKADLTIHERYFPEGLNPPENAVLICLKGYQGTGKTEWLARKIQPLLNRGEKIVVIVHREQLAMALAERFGVSYRTEINKIEHGNLFGYTLCIDSLHDKANPPVYGDSDYWDGATVIIDEAEQVLWHVLNGSTCQKHRVRILTTFKALLQKVVGTGGKIYIADADLTNIAVSYIKALIGCDVPTWIVKNTYNPVTTGQRVLFWYRGKNPSGLINKAKKLLKEEKKLLFFVDGQKHKSNHGTRNLEHHFKKIFPHLKILRIDSESLGDKNHPAFGCMNHLNEVLLNYDLVLCSPTVETGVSITNNHFDEIFVISHCVQTVEAVNQSLERDRSHIPRHLWCQEWGNKSIGNGSIEIKPFLNGTYNLSNAHIKQLQKVGINEFDGIRFLEEDLPENRQAPSLWAWGKRACVFNYQNRNFARCLEQKLLDAGYRIVEGEEMDETTKQEISISQAENYSKYCIDVSNIPNPDNTTYERLKEQKGGTEEELLQKRKGEVCRCYITEEVSPELVKKDDDGWYAKLKFHYYLTIGNKFLIERDRQSLSKLRDDGDGTVFRPDVNKTQLGTQIAVLKWMNVERFFDETAEFTSYQLQEEFDLFNNPLNAYQLKTILGIKLSEKDTPIGFYQRLLQQMFGMKLLFDRWETIDGKARRVYKGCALDADDRLQVLHRFFKRDEEIQENVAA